VKTHHAKNRIRGITLIEVLVVVFAIALIAAMLLPVLAKANRKSSRIGCVNNLKQAALAFRICEGDNNDNYPMQFAITNSDMMKLISDGNAYVLWQSMSNELSTQEFCFVLKTRNTSPR
jgi:type II secretory pathway pseudopilin PulG